MTRVCWPTGTCAQRFPGFRWRSIIVSCSCRGQRAGGVLTAAQDADDGTNFAADDVSGFNVNTIALEVPIALLLTNVTNVTLPVSILSYLIYSYDPTVAAISTVQILIVAVLLFALDRLFGLNNLVFTSR